VLSDFQTKENRNVILESPHKWSSLPQRSMAASLIIAMMARPFSPTQAVVTSERMPEQAIVQNCATGPV
jgi:hypothetical protein